VTTKRLSHHIVLCGLDGVGFRTLEELRGLGEDVVVIALRPPDDLFRVEVQDWGVPIIEGSYRSEVVLRAAGVVNARGIVITEDDDVANLQAALQANALNPALHIVVRMFNQEFGERVRSVVPHCTIVSSSAIAAPAFVTAALQGDTERRIEVAGRALILRRAAADDPQTVLALGGRGRPAALFPESGEDVLCLVDGGPVEVAAAAAAPGRLSALGDLRTIWALARQIDRRLFYFAALLAIMVLISASIFYAFAGLGPLDALYFTVTVVTTTGFGDISVRDAPPALKVYVIALMFFGATTLAVVYAFITDAIVGARLATALGRSYRRMRGHVIVGGAGTVGYRIVQELVRRGVPVLAVELQESGRLVGDIRRLGVPVLMGDARQSEVLRQASIDHARALILATADDLTNLETVLSARALNPHIRLVLRLSDATMAAGHVERTFGVHTSRSVAALVAPAFAAAAMGHRGIATIKVGEEALIVAQAHVEAESWAAGRPSGQLADVAQARLLSITREGEQHWRPTRDMHLQPGDEFAFVATRHGVNEVWARTEAGAEVRESLQLRSRVRRARSVPGLEI
jgi:Trk K+ transport system NAD-binding subunit